MAAAQVVNATVQYASAIRGVLGTLAPYILRAANVSRWEVSTRPALSDEIGQYEHGSRAVYVVPNLPQAALRAMILHEVAHAFDDILGVGHYFGESPHWVALLHQQGYQEDTVEAFAEAMAEHLADPVRMRQGNPTMATFLDGTLAFLKHNFG